MTPDDDLLEYRVGQLESAVEVLSQGVVDLREFAVSIKAWMRALALLWALIASIMTAILSAAAWHYISG